MNCMNHPTEAAVAQCTDCGKGLCIQCVSQFKPILCDACAQKRKKSTIRHYVVPLIAYTVLFIIGYRLNFMATKSFPDTQILSGYILMSLLSGYQLVNVIFPFHLTSGSTGTWLIYYVFKLALYAIAGFFTAPFTIAWNIYKLVRTTRLKN